MKLFADEETERVFHTGFSTRCSRKIAKQAQRVMHHLLPAHGFEDVVFIAGDRIERWPGTSASFGIHVEGKWFIAFEWCPPFGAAELLLAKGRTPEK
jgi:plasmid maintenance system killer protein